MMVTEQDYERLSGYLDNTLTATERQQLEARLNAEPTLRAELEALRGTVALLRGLPTLKSPRDFTLTPAMAARPAPTLGVVPKRRAQPFYTSAAFSALSAAAAFVLVALSVILLNTRQMPTQAPLNVALQPSATALPVQADDQSGSSAVMDAAPAAMPTTGPAEQPESMAAGAAAAMPASAEAETQAQSAQATSLPATAESAVMNFSAAPTQTLSGTNSVADGMLSSNAAGPGLTGTPSPGADSLMMESLPAAAAREGVTGTPTPAPTQTAATFAQPLTPLLAATMAPSGTTVAALPPADAALPAPQAAPIPPPAQSVPLARSVLPLVLLGAGIVLGLLAVISTLLRRRAA
jgi:hypothetical protein